MSRFSIQLFLGIFFFAISISSKVSAADGKAIYKQNCAVCHALTDQRLTGPGLKGVADRVPKPSDEWLLNWIKNNEKMIKAGDAYGVKLFNDYGKAAMTVFEGTLSDDDIKAVIQYIKNPPVEKKDVVVADNATGTAAGKTEDSGTSTLYLLLIVVAGLAIMAVILREVRFSLQNVVNRKEGKQENEHISFWKESKEWLSGHRRFLGVCFVILAFWGMKGCWDGLWEIGVYTGYQPEQPIKFSHKIHAGDNAIACQYCHSSVEKSRHAGIPSVNVCMNCHKSISTGPTTGETEIAKIYAAAGFDPKTLTYDQNKANPLKWIKVHNLPDHVYFNHSQHVVVGKQECATCHGDLKTMTVAQQVQPLTMGWCIDCHRKTEVAMEGNDYYTKLHENLKKQYAGKKKFTVAEMGGIECAKCHY